MAAVQKGLPSSLLCSGVGLFEPGNEALGEATSSICLSTPCPEAHSAGRHAWVPSPVLPVPSPSGLRCLCPSPRGERRAPAQVSAPLSCLSLLHLGCAPGSGWAVSWTQSWAVFGLTTACPGKNLTKLQAPASLSPAGCPECRPHCQGNWPARLLPCIVGRQHHVTNHHEARL